MRSLKNRGAWFLRRAPALALIVTMALVVGCGQQILGRAAVEPEPSSWYIDPQRFNDGAHGDLTCSACHIEITTGDLPDEHPDVDGLSCSQCHVDITEDILGEHPNPDNLTSDATELFNYEACDACHPEEYEHYQQGAHAELLSGARESESEYPAPTCGHCHDPHYRQAGLARLQIIDAQVGICGQCHPSEVETYLDNYHGKTAVDLDYEESASCADCHGFHRVLALDQPQETLEACRKCHPDASENMAGFLIHAEQAIVLESGASHARESVPLFFAQLLFILLTAGVLGFFYVHSLLWLLRALHEKLRRR